MSVLNEINVTTGAALRILASNTSCHDAKRFFGAFKGHKAVRMDDITYSEPMENLSSEVLNIVSHYWTDDDGNVNWGLPKCTWDQYIGNLIEDENNWRRGAWEPDVERHVDEDRARDMLLASYLFPFVANKRHADPWVTEVLLPVLEGARSDDVRYGNAAVTELMSKVAGDGSAREAMNEYSNANKALSDFADFNKVMTLLEFATSPSRLDAPAAAKKAETLDPEMISNAGPYLGLAKLVNQISAHMFKSNKRGVCTRKLNEFLKRQRFANDDSAPAWERMDAELAKDKFLKKVINGTSELNFRTQFGAHAICSKDVVLLTWDAITYVLTREDLKSLKFGAISHSMWHVHSSSILMEYSETIDLSGEDESPSDREYTAALNQLGKDLEVMLDKLTAKVPLKQKIVDYQTVKQGIKSLWEFYCSITATAISINKTDYLGRYLHEIFSVYTAKLAGKLMDAGYKAAYDEVVEEYTDTGFAADSDLQRFLSIAGTLPLSIVQDFGRLSKIALPYDVHPIYSYLDRSAKMHKPNPRGNSHMVSDYDAVVTPFTEEERNTSNELLVCSMRVLLTMGDIRSNIVGGLTSEEYEEFEGFHWAEILQRVRDDARAITTSAQLRLAPDVNVPEELAEVAREQAIELLKSGEQPKNPYAGAFLDITNLVSYVKKEDNDLSLVKATAVPADNIAIVLSNLSSIPRMTPTRDTDGKRDRIAGTMVTDYLLDRFPNRREALAYIAEEIPIAATSDKVETNKYPKKTRIIVSLCAAARRLQGEYEYNTGRICVHVPGYMIGRNPAELYKSMYAAMKDDVAQGKMRLYGSLDLSSFSTGMHWDVQHVTNTVLGDAYGWSDKFLDLIEKCTKDSLMVRSESGVRLAMKNTIGSNYEGIDGKRNTLMHCAIWYIARCTAYDKGISGNMRAFLYIDDGAFAVDLDKDKVDEGVKIMREALLQTYIAYGLKINLLKTVISSAYMQFLNELYLHGIHVGYGFRALCHTAAQEFPKVASVMEELAVIHSGIRGAAVAGGHPLRLLVGYHYLLFAYLDGMVGYKGRHTRIEDPVKQAILLMLPTIAGGYGLPSWLSLFTNLAGNRDVEKLDRVRLISAMMKSYLPSVWTGVRKYMLKNMMEPKTVDAFMVPDRLTVAHPGTAKFGDLGRNDLIAVSAKAICVNREASDLLDVYIRTKGRPGVGTFPDLIAKYSLSGNVALPVALLEKALEADPTAAMSTLIKKVASSYVINRLLTGSEIAMINGRLKASARNIVALYQESAWL